MKISKEEVLHVADLARLVLTEKEREIVTEQMETILSYVNKLSEIDTSNAPTTTHAHKKINAFRDDVVFPSLPRKEVLSNAPQKNEKMFEVPRIL